MKLLTYHDEPLDYSLWANRPVMFFFFFFLTCYAIQINCHWIKVHQGLVEDSLNPDGLLPLLCTTDARNRRSPLVFCSDTRVTYYTHWCFHHYKQCSGDNYYQIHQLLFQTIKQANLSRKLKLTRI